MSLLTIHSHALPAGVQLLYTVDGFPTWTLKNLQGHVVGKALVRPRPSSGAFLLEIHIPQHHRGTTEYGTTLLRAALEQLFDLHGSPIELFVGRGSADEQRQCTALGGSLCPNSEHQELLKYVFHSKRHAQRYEPEAVAA